ncbi:MAG: hypothetical protein RBS17_04990 [Coriobacteriia bacterium]|nr:hypothetical protein [Coriobacteriia bacterium]
MARESLGASSVRLLTVYARRPKVRYPGDHQILMRVNLELYAAAKIAEEIGCPVLAGIPLVNDLKNLVVGARCCWFRVHAPGPSGAVSDTVHLDARTGDLLEHPLGLSALRTSDLVEVARDAEQISWAAAVKAVRAFRLACGEHRGWWSGGAYKPFHMLILDD